MFSSSPSSCSNIELSRIVMLKSPSSQADRPFSSSFSLESPKFICRISSHRSELLTPHKIALNSLSPLLALPSQSSHSILSNSRSNLETRLPSSRQSYSGSDIVTGTMATKSATSSTGPLSSPPCLLSTLFQSYSFIQSNLSLLAATLSAHSFRSVLNNWPEKISDIRSQKHEYSPSTFRSPPSALDHPDFREPNSLSTNTTADDKSQRLSRHRHQPGYHQHGHHQHLHSTPVTLSSSSSSSFVSIVIIAILITLLSITPQHVNGLSSIRILAPDYIFYGDSMWLNCSADLDYNQIYSIKWFKDNQEMYRFITSDEIPTTFYQTTGITIDEKRSNFGNVYIKKTDFKMDANFRCEVLAENDFNTVIEIKKIKVYYIPRDGQPIILGKKANFRPNEMVNLTCTAPMSTPAARLMVTLNGNTITENSNYYQRLYHNQYDNGLTSSSVDVQFPSYWLQTKKTNNFVCSSSIVHRYNRTASVKFEARTNAENTVAFYLDGQQQSSSSQHESNYIQPQPTQDRLAPKIENFKKKYEIGELINLRCISAQYKPMPELYWLLDGIPVDAQYVDYRHSDYNQNGYVRVDLKYRLDHKAGSVSSPSHHQKRNNRSSILSSLSPTYTHTTTNTGGNVYNFRCVQVLSDVISVATEVAELYNFVEGQALHGNSVEAVKSLIGNGISSPLNSLMTTSIGLLFVLLYFVLIA